MAVETRIWCDKCGERIYQERTLLAAKSGKLRHREPIDLCSTCSDDLTEWLGPIVGRKATDKPAEPVPSMASVSRRCEPALIVPADA